MIHTQATGNINQQMIHSSRTSIKCQQKRKLRENLGKTMSFFLMLLPQKVDLSEIKDDKQKKKKGSRWNSQQLTPQTNVRRRGRNVVHHTLGSPEEVSTCRNEQVKCLGHPYSTSTDNKESEEITSLTQASFHNNPVHCTANVHVYDHSKRLFSIEVDNNNVFQSINTCLKDNRIMPPDNMMVIMYNGKAISEDWQPEMENEDNIHVFVKGRGGMQRDDFQSNDLEDSNACNPTTSEDNDNTPDEVIGVRGTSGGNLLQQIKDKCSFTELFSAQSPVVKTIRNLVSKERTSQEESNQITCLLEEYQTLIRNTTKYERGGAVFGSLAECPNIAEVLPNDEQGIAKVQVSDESQFTSTMSQGSEASRARLIEELALNDYFPGQLTFADVMAIQHEEKEEADTLADIPRLILRKLIMLDFTSREDDLHECFIKLCRHWEIMENGSKNLSSDTVNEEDDDSFDNIFNGDEYMQISSNDEKHSCDSLSDLAGVVKWNPIDVFLSIFVCLDPTMKQKICLKMFSCHLAIPLIFPVQIDEHHSKRLMFSLWPLRPITVHDGKREICVVNCKQNIVSIIRLGRPPLSKSKLANTFLYDAAHNPFFHYDCKLGSCDKKASLGLVEASWFLPSPKQRNIFNSVTLFLNLRGDGFCNSEQVDYLKRVSKVLVVVIDIETVINNNKRLAYLKAPHQTVLFLVTGKLNHSVARRCTQIYTRSKPDGFNAEFIPLMDDGRIISMAEIKEILLTKTRECLDGNRSSKTMHDLCKHAQHMGIAVDEDAPTCKIGMKLTKSIFDMVKKSDLGGINMKKMFTPLQFEPWKQYTHHMKKLFLSDHDVIERYRLKQKMISCREPQSPFFGACSKPLMYDFERSITNIEGDVLVYFLDSLTFCLDEKSRGDLHNHQERLVNVRHALTVLQNENMVMESVKKETDKIEEELGEASFGIEHIFREIGQIYESSLHSYENNIHTNLPQTIANLMIQGYPLELMDGDVGNIPLQWVESVFEKLKTILNDERVLTLSILGLQSSGKSTLLNAMFGLTFPVSAGRCTRGIYLQLLPVTSNDCDFNYVLVVDTEGLRAQELGDQKYQRDNQLATLVLGMSDITLINIMGENTSEMNEILQLCASSFLKLKMASESLKLHQSCVFIHQNVTDVNAKASLSQARTKLTNTLNEITLDAAKAGNRSEITTFNDVVTFDSDQQVFYFADLWEGAPPMAPANPVYSQDVRRLKSCIFDTLARQNRSYLTISETFVHIKDLWKGILTNDFVFCFRNRLEMAVYDKLKERYQETVGELKRYKDQLEVAMFDDDELCKTDFPLHSNYDKKVKELRHNLEEYLEDTEKQYDISTWKDAKLHSWDIFASQLRKKLSDMLSRGKDEHESLLALATLIKDVYTKATDLAATIRGNQPVDIAKIFDENWDEWIPKTEPVDIDDLIESILHNTFPGDRHGFISAFTTTRFSFRIFRYSNFVSDSDIQTKSLHGRLTSKRKANNLARDISLDMSSRLKEGISQTNWTFNEKLMKQYPKLILQQLDEFNNNSQNSFTVLESFKRKLVVHCFKQWRPLLKRTYEEYKTKHCTEVKLRKHKDNVRKYFFDNVNVKPASVIASNIFCDIIEAYAGDKVRAQLPYTICEHIVDNKFGKSKQVLITYVLEGLAKQQQLEPCIEYIDNPFSYTFKCLEKYINAECFDNRVYVTNALSKLNEIFSDIFNFMNNCRALSLEEWISDFQREIKRTLLVHTESLLVVEVLEVTTLNDFITATKEKLKQVRVNLEDKFKNESKTSIEWYGKTPYEMSMEKLWGCRATCPFCNEPCKWNSDHSGPHSCIQHRPQGIAGQKRTFTSKLWVESCNDVVSTRTYTYNCFSHPDNKCNEGHLFMSTHLYRNYKHYFPDWDIPPCSDVSASTYWAWVLCTFNRNLAKHYTAKNADIPSIWKSITKQQAIKSLQQYN